MPQWLSSDVRDLISLMLKKNPLERISVSKVLDHKWIKRGENFGPINIQSPFNIKEDNEAFHCCLKLFPELTQDQLRNKIKDFGYITATYLLLQNNSDAKKVIFSILME